MIPESHYSKTLAQQKIRTLLVSYSIHCMLAAINFHDQFLLQTAEVYYISADRPLAPEFGAAQSSISQMEP